MGQQQAGQQQASECVATTKRINQINQNVAARWYVSQSIDGPSEKNTNKSNKIEIDAFHVLAPCYSSLCPYPDYPDARRVGFALFVSLLRVCVSLYLGLCMHACAFLFSVMRAAANCQRLGSSSIA